MGIEGTYLNIVKAINDKPTANLILNGEKLKAFSLRSGTRQGYPLSPILFNTVLEILATAIRGGEKRNPGWKRSKILTVCRGHDTIHTQKKPKNTIRKLLELITEFSKVIGYKVNTQKSLAFLYTNNEKSERKIKESIPFTIGTKIIKYLGLNLPKETKELYTENYKTPMKEIKDDINRWRDIPCSWVGRTNIVKMTTLSHAIYYQWHFSQN